MKEAKLRVSVMVTGIKKRCRNTGRHLIEVAHAPLDCNKEAYAVLARAKASDAMKVINHGSIHFDFVEIENRDGMTCTSFQIFDPRNIKMPLVVVPS